MGFTIAKFLFSPNYKLNNLYVSEDNHIKLRRGRIIKFKTSTVLPVHRKYNFLIHIHEYVWINYRVLWCTYVLQNFSKEGYQIKSFISRFMFWMIITQMKTWRHLPLKTRCWWFFELHHILTTQMLKCRSVKGIKNTA